MPLAVFDALRGGIQSFLGGAEVNLIPGQQGAGAHAGQIMETVIIDDLPFSFVAHRSTIPFTRSETAFCRELLTAFSSLQSGFRQQGYAAQFRTALLVSIMDITVARSLRVDHRKEFWPIQQMIQLLKGLSYQRYEGTPATTGFLIHRTTQPALHKMLTERGHTLIPLQPHIDITPTLFDNPLTYRLVDGANQFFVANIQMQVSGVISTSTPASNNDIERLTQREMFSLVRRAGRGAFGITVNESSEIEIQISPARLLIRRQGSWAIFDPAIFRSFLAGSIDQVSADELIWTVYALSKARHGTVILVYDRSDEQLAALKRGSVGGDDPLGQLLTERVRGRSIADLKRSGILLRILTADGMTVFGPTGELRETGFIIDTSHTRELVTGGGRTTAAYSASFFGRVIKVSQDGPIELYQDGRLIYRFG